MYLAYLSGKKKYIKKKKKKKKRFIFKKDFQNMFFWLFSLVAISRSSVGLLFVQ